MEVVNVVSAVIWLIIFIGFVIIFCNIALQEYR